MSAEPALFVLWYDFSKWLLEKTATFPRNVRFSFANRLDNLTLDIVEGIIEARYSVKKTVILRRVDLRIEKLRVLIRMSHDLKYIDHNAYEFAARKLNEAGKMAGGWRRHQEAKDQ